MPYTHIYWSDASPFWLLICVLISAYSPIVSSNFSIWRVIRLFIRRQPEWVTQPANWPPCKGRVSKFRILKLHGIQFWEVRVDHYVFSDVLWVIANCWIWFAIFAMVSWCFLRKHGEIPSTGLWKSPWFMAQGLLRYKKFSWDISAVEHSIWINSCMFCANLGNVDFYLFVLSSIFM